VRVEAPGSDSKSSIVVVLGVGEPPLPFVAANNCTATQNCLDKEEKKCEKQDEETQSMRQKMAAIATRQGQADNPNKTYHLQGSRWQSYPSDIKLITIAVANRYYLRSTIKLPCLIESSSKIKLSLCRNPVLVLQEEGTYKLSQKVVAQKNDSSKFNL
jgi:hypothetical protein